MTSIGHDNEEPTKVDGFQVSHTLFILYYIFALKTSPEPRTVWRIDGTDGADGIDRTDGTDGTYGING